MGLPRLPSISLASVDSQHVDFVRMFRNYHNQRLTRELCHILAHNVHFALGEAYLVDNIFQTLLQYVGEPLDDQWTDILARQLAARKEELKGGVLQLYECPLREEWVPLEVYSLIPSVWRETRDAQILNLYCLAGHPAGHRLQKKLPESWLAYLAYQIGFSSRFRYEYEPTEFIGLRFWGFMKRPARGREELDFEQYKASGQLEEHNRLIIARRQRFNFQPDALPRNCSCPFDLDCYCSDCRHPVEVCVASYDREQTYVKRERLAAETTNYREP